MYGNDPVYWIADSGHAWLAVNVTEYPDAAQCGTGYGYRRGSWIYLEGDCEAALFFARNPELTVNDVTRVDRYEGDAPVRSFGRNMDHVSV